MSGLTMSVIGCGYLGAVHAAAMASLGHRVIGIDTNLDRLDALRSGRAPFYEPGLEPLLTDGSSSGVLMFSSDVSDARTASTHFICVGTPQAKSASSADLTFVYGAIDSLLPHLSAGDIVVGKSTVPVGTAQDLEQRILERGAHLVWNPEFLREGWAVKDTVEPDRIVIGVAPGTDPAVIAAMRQVYASACDAGTPFLVTDFATAELVKVSANAFLATKISFINAMAEIAEATGADVMQLADAIGLDERIGRRYLGAGIGFGGGCLPKDIRAFAARAEELGLRDTISFLREMDAINLRRRDRAVDLVVEALDGQPLGKKVAVLGASFKPFSDDVRDSPGLEVATRLHGLGADVVVTDPQAIDNAQLVSPQLEYARDLDTALLGADCVIIVTEWDEYRRELSIDHVNSLVTTRSIVDGRNCLDPDAWRSQGWTYRGMGRP